MYLSVYMVVLGCIVAVSALKYWLSLQVKLTNKIHFISKNYILIYFFCIRNTKGRR